MKKTMGFLFVLLFTGSLTWAYPPDPALNQSNQDSLYKDPVNATPRAGDGTPMAVLPPTGWTDLSGTVKGFDRVSQTLQLRDRKGNVYLIPIDNQITMNRGKKNISFSQLQKGDTVHLHMSR